MVGIDRNVSRGRATTALTTLTVLSVVALAGCMNPRGGSGDIRGMEIPGKDYAMPANFRLVVSNPRNRNNTTNDIVCTEPSPDAIAVAAEALSVSISAAQYGGGSVASGIAQAAVPLFARSQAIAAVRDTVTAACLAYQNGIISRFGYFMAAAAYPDLLMGAMAVEGVTDRPLHLGGGVAAPVPGVSTSASTSGSESTGADGATSSDFNQQATGTVTGQQGRFGTGLQSPTTRANSDAASIAAVKDLVDVLLKQDRVFGTACIMYLTDPSEDPVDETITTACRAAVTAIGHTIAFKTAALDPKKGKPIEMRVTELEKKTKNLDNKVKAAAGVAVQNLEQKNQEKIFQDIGRYVVESLEKKAVKKGAN